VKPWFDLARLLFALVVVIDHAVILFWLPTNAQAAIHWFPWLNSAAAISVSGFFLISGFAIAHSVTPKRRNFGLRLFLANRIARIYPPLLCAILLALALAYFIIPIHNIDISEPAPDKAFGIQYFITNALQFAQGQQVLNTLMMLAPPLTTDYETWPLLAPAWTLPYEIVMYAVAGISFRLFQTQRTAPTAAAVLLWTALVGWIIVVDSPQLYLLSGLWSLGFIIGLSHRYRPGMALAGVGILTALAGPFFVLRFLATITETSGLSADAIAIQLGSPYDDSWPFTGGLAMMAFGLFFAVGTLNKWLANHHGYEPKPAIGLVPEFSYSLYICHFPLLLAWGVLQTQATDGFPSGPLWFVILPPTFIALGICWAISIAAEQKDMFSKAIGRVLGVKPMAGRIK